MSISSPVGTVNTYTFPYTGSVHTFVLPRHDGLVRVTLWAGSGGTFPQGGTSYLGGLGGTIRGDVAIANGTIVSIYPGQAATTASGGSSSGSGRDGGDATGGNGYGGGGATVVQLPSGLLMVAGGGGGGASKTSLLPALFAGDGGFGHADGEDDAHTVTAFNGEGGDGGTHSAAGAGGMGAGSITTPPSAGTAGSGGAGGDGGAATRGGGGGGGGYFGGGGGGGGSNRGAGGGGGSSWAHASVTGVTSVAALALGDDGYVTIQLDELPPTDGWSVGFLKF